MATKMKITTWIHAPTHLACRIRNDPNDTQALAEAFCYLDRIHGKRRKDDFTQFFLEDLTSKNTWMEIDTDLLLVMLGPDNSLVKRIKGEEDDLWEERLSEEWDR